TQLSSTTAFITTVETDIRTYRVAVLPIELAQDTEPGLFIEAFDVSAELRSLQVSLAVFIGAGVGALAIGALVAWTVVGRIMQPVRDLTETAQRISDQNLDARLQPRGHDEFADLTETINDMLDRLQQAVEQQRQLLDDVG